MFISTSNSLSTAAPSRHTWPTSAALGKERADVIVMENQHRGVVMLDYLFRGARVVDGTGAAAFKADVGVKDGLIAVMGKLGDAEADTTIDASGKVLCPGFIDIHTHNDLYVCLLYTSPSP